jgi:hypothetical protein
MQMIQAGMGFETSFSEGAEHSSEEAEQSRSDEVSVVNVLGVCFGEEDSGGAPEGGSEDGPEGPGDVAEKHGKQREADPAYWMAAHSWRVLEMFPPYSLDVWHY